MTSPSARHAQEIRVTNASMATFSLVKTVTGVRTLAVRRVLISVVVTRARLGTGDKRVTIRVIQDVTVMCVIRPTEVVHADQASMEAVVKTYA